jgi:hypothetical protein
MLAVVGNIIHMHSRTRNWWWGNVCEEKCILEVGRRACVCHADSTPPLPPYSNRVLWLDLTPCSRVFLEKLTVAQLVKKYFALHETWRFITAFRRTTRWASLTLSTHSHRTSLRSSLTLSYRLQSCGFIRTDFPTTILHSHRSDARCASHPTKTWRSVGYKLWIVNELYRTLQNLSVPWDLVLWRRKHVYRDRNLLTCSLDNREMCTKKGSLDERVNREIAGGDSVNLLVVRNIDASGLHKVCCVLEEDVTGFLGEREMSLSASRRYRQKHLKFFPIRKWLRGEESFLRNWYSLIWSRNLPTFMESEVLVPEPITGPYSETDESSSQPPTLLP